MKWFMLAAGGICGTLGRYALSNLVNRWTETQLPYGTFVVNVIGCFLIGMLAALSDKRLLLNPEVRLFAVTGLLGAFTTFSSLIYESAQLTQQGQLAMALLNVLASIALGFIAFWVGSLVVDALVA